MNKNIFKGKNTALFDLDGTIVETKPIVLKALRQILEENELSFVNEEDYFITGGIDWKDIWEAVKIADAPSLEKSTTDLGDETHKRYIELLKEADLVVKEGLWDLLYELREEKKFKIGLTTNSEKDIAEVVMEKLSLDDVFDFAIFGDSVKKKKPNPEMYKKSLKGLKSRPSETIVFEDSLIGSEAAAKIKLDLIIVWNGEIPKYRFPGTTKLYIYDFTELVGTLDETKYEYVLRRVKEVGGIPQNPS